MRNYFVFVLLGFIFQSLTSQIVINPGSNLIRYNSLTNRTNDFKSRLIDQNSVVKYESISQTQLLVDKAKGELIVVQTRNAMNDRIIDSTFADFKSLKPIRMSMSSDSKQNTMDLRFNEESIHALVMRKNHFTDTIHKINKPYFDSNLLETLIGVIDYSKDSLFKLNTYTYEMGGLDSYLIKRIGKEELELPNLPKIIAWHIIILQEKAIKMGQTNGYEFWIDVNKGLVVKQVIAFGENKGKYVITLEAR